LFTTKLKYQYNKNKKEWQIMSVHSLCEWRKKQVEHSTSKSQSQQNTTSDELGQILTDEEAEHIAAIFTVVQAAKIKPFTTKSDFARHWATHVALAACEGLISTRLSEEKFTNIWMVTADGLDWMSEVEDVLRD
jgi:hypothetical protein